MRPLSPKLPSTFRIITNSFLVVSSKLRKAFSNGGVDNLQPMGCMQLKEPLDPAHNCEALVAFSGRELWHTMPPCGKAASVCPHSWLPQPQAGLFLQPKRLSTTVLVDFSTIYIKLFPSQSKNFLGCLCPAGLASQQKAR